MVIDLHSDFLSYLTSSPKNGPFDDESKTSPRQLKEGGVHTLVTVTYASTKQSASADEAVFQMKKYHEMLQSLPDVFASPLCPMAGERVTLIPAIENSSSFALEGEPLDNVFKRFQSSFHSILPLYISLTWNEENRFGGGAHTTQGLKEDGKALLDFLEKRVFAIDLSHASDKLATDMIEYVEKKGLFFQFMASHSNFRDVMPHQRNLPLDIASYIVQRGGVLGLTLVESFIGKSLEDFLGHIAYGIDHGFENNMALGGDFFSVTGLKHVSEVKKRYHFPEADSAACYPFLLRMIQKTFSPSIAKALEGENAKRRLIDPYMAMVVRGSPA
jgi:microsomal dipeptidase-like Zn-dependent dipeptidase